MASKDKKRSNNEIRFKRKNSLFSVSLLLLFVFLSISLIKSLYDSILHQRRIIKEREEKYLLEKEVNDLKQEISFYQSDSFIEMEGRDRLGMIKNGEKVVILSEEDVKELDQFNQNSKTAESGAKVHNLEKWVSFFLSF